MSELLLVTTVDKLLVVAPQTTIATVEAPLFRPEFIHQYSVLSQQIGLLLSRRLKQYSYVGELLIVITVEEVLAVALPIMLATTKASFFKSNFLYQNVALSDKNSLAPTISPKEFSFVSDLLIVTTVDQLLAVALPTALATTKASLFKSICLYQNVAALDKNSLILAIKLKESRSVIQFVNGITVDKVLAVTPKTTIATVRPIFFKTQYLKQYITFSYKKSYHYKL